MRTPTKKPLKTTFSKLPKVKIKLDDPAYFPTPDSFGGFDLKVGQLVTLNPRKSIIIDCGLALDLPMNYRIEIMCSTEFSNKGLILSTNTYPTGDNVRLTVFAHNTGHEILVFKPATLIGKFWFNEATSALLVDSSC